MYGSQTYSMRSEGHLEERWRDTVDIRESETAGGNPTWAILKGVFKF